ASASRAEYSAVIHHDTTTHTTGREGGRVLAHLDGVDPLAVARRRVHGGDALATREVHHAVVHDRRELRVDGALQREAPGHAQVLDVLLGYLVERAVPPHVEGPTVGRPLAGCRVQQLVGGLSRRNAR